MGSQQTTGHSVSAKCTNMAFLCACLVVFIHVGTCGREGGVAWWLTNLLKYGPGGMAMPFFFCASGYFLARHAAEDGWWARECRKRVRSLLVPYLLWSTLYFLLCSALILQSNVREGAPLLRYLPTTVGQWLNVYGISFNIWPYCYPLWYVRWLLVLVLCSGGLVAFLGRGRRLALGALAALFVVSSVLEPLLMKHPVLQVVSWQGLFFFTLGLFLRLHVSESALCARTWPKALCAGLFLAGLALCAVILQGRLAGWRWSEPLNFSMISLVLLSVWPLVPERVVVGRLAACAFPLYLLHVFVLRILAIAWPRYEQQGVVGVTAAWILTILGSLIATFLLRRFLPRTAALLFGGR